MIMFDSKEVNVQRGKITSYELLIFNIWMGEKEINTGVQATASVKVIVIQVVDRWERKLPIVNGLIQLC